jgi:hypothetical protein
MQVVGTMETSDVTTNTIRMKFVVLKEPILEQNDLNDEGLKFSYGILFLKL